MSAPAQKARPAPVTIATHASSSARNRCHASLSATRIGPLIALRRSGRLYVIVATCPSRKYMAGALAPSLAPPALLVLTSAAPARTRSLRRARHRDPPG